MKIGISFEEEEHDRYFGRSRYEREQQHFPVDIELSPLVQEAVELTRPFWSQTSDIPIVIADGGGHGFDRGLVIHGDTCDYSQDTDFTRSSIRTRISFGGELAGNRFDFLKDGRLHVSIYAGRQFFPQEWQEYIPVEGNQRFDDDHRETTPVIEEVHVSFRWLVQEFDDWSDTELWLKEATSKVMGRKSFDSRRTTYCAAIKIHDVSKRENHSSREMGIDEKLAFVQQEGRKKPLLRYSPSVQPFSHSHAYANKLLERFFYHGVSNRLPVIGYQEVAGALYEILPYRTNNDIARMKKEEGVRFLFSDVMAGLQKFVSHP